MGQQCFKATQPRDTDELKSPSFEAMNLDVFKHMLRFCDRVDHAALRSVSTFCNRNLDHNLLDSVHDCASFNEQEQCYHIKPISSQEKRKKVIDVKSLVTDDEEYMLPLDHHADFTWAMFVARKMREQCSNGYWKVIGNLSKDTLHTCTASNYAPAFDLAKIRALCMHRRLRSQFKRRFEAAQQQESGCTQEHEPILVHIHDEQTQQVRAYKVCFWNGCSTNQSCALRVTCVHSAKTNFYLYFKAQPAGMEWQWYDNDIAAFKPYEAGPELGRTVQMQLEAAFQSNLTHNFPPAFLRHIGKAETYFERTQMTRLRKAIVEPHSVCDKRFIFRCYFGTADNPIDIMEQIAISHYGSFARDIRRVTVPV